MNVLLTIIVFVLIFSLLILVHELGHFVMAKRSGIKVEEFGFGLPPRIWGKKKGGTIYSINAIPFGGFVRMLGEDVSDPSAVKHKDSFIAKPMRTRVKVLVAGVLMNFLLAWVLLIVGLTVGMQPLITPSEVLPSIENGTIVLNEGLIVKDLVSGGFAGKLGIKMGDIIYSFDGNKVSTSVDGVIKLLEAPAKKYDLIRDGKHLVLDNEIALKTGEKFDFGADFNDYALFTRVRVFDLPSNTEAYKAGLRAGDFIIKVGGKQIFTVIDFESALRGVTSTEIEVYRNGIHELIAANFKQGKNIIISQVLADSPGASAGLKEGDLILSVNGKTFLEISDLVAFVEEHDGKELAFNIERGGKTILFEIIPKDGKVGMLLSELISYGGSSGLSVYNSEILSSVVDIKQEKYPFFTATYKAFGEGVSLVKLSAGVFFEFLGNLVKTGAVSKDVAGPIGIYQMTGIFVQQGLISIVRFVAILSLSLAAINILPLPALDGGRLLFILLEFLLGKKVGYKWEALVHSIGYGLIIILILLVSYSDIMRLLGLR